MTNSKLSSGQHCSNGTNSKLTLAASTVISVNIMLVPSGNGRPCAVSNSSVNIGLRNGNGKLSLKSVVRYSVALSVRCK